MLHVELGAVLAKRVGMVGNPVIVAEGVAVLRSICWILFSFLLRNRGKRKLNRGISFAGRFGNAVIFSVVVEWGRSKFGRIMRNGGRIRRQRLTVLRAFDTD
jgi:hypothetical protein